MTKWPQQFWLITLIMILASASSLVVGCSPSTSTPPLIPTQFSYQVRVQAKDTSEYIPSAKVTVEVSGQAPLDSMTDSDGLARLFIGSSYMGQPGFLIVEAKGYKRYTQNIDVTMDALPDVVLLERLAAVTLTPTVTPIETRMDTTFDYQVRVQAKDTGEYIQGAVVTIEVVGQAPLDNVTDSKGVSRIFISSVHAGKPGFLIVEAKGYKRYTQNIDLIMDSLPDVVLLERSLGVTPTPTFTPTPHIGPSTTPTPTLTPITTNTSTSTPTFTHTPTRTETPTDIPVFICTPTQAKIPTAIPTATDTPTLASTQTISYTIEFRASKTVVNPGEWVIFRWHVENVQAVYLDWKGGVGAPGEGWDSRQMWETTDPDHTLRVVLKNGETVTRTITVTVRE